MRKLVRGLVNKLLHAPSTRLKQGGGEADGMLYGDALTTLFALAPEEEAGAKADDDANVVRLPVTSE